jgi:phosphoribosylformylglycinamidine (FGAM) synthase PurS component
MERQVKQPRKGKARQSDSRQDKAEQAKEIATLKKLISNPNVHVYNN